MSATDHFDAFVIGGGAAGSEAAFRLAEGGLLVGLAERDRLGGECNHDGCVPTKVMLRSAQLAHAAAHAGGSGVTVPKVEVDLAAVQARARRVIDELSGDGAASFRRAGITVFDQEARLRGPHDVDLADGRRLRCGRIVLATGTEPEIPPIPGLTEGPFWTNHEAIWDRSTIPSSLGVIGSGAVGLEFAQIYARFGSRVTVLEAADRPLPREDAEAARVAVEAFVREGIEVRASVEILAAAHADDGWRLDLGGTELVVEELLVATGRRPVFHGHDLDAAGVSLDGDGRPLLDAMLRSTQPVISVIGDATGDLLFTHVATYEAGIVARDILGDPMPADLHLVPRVTFCEPEIASIGLTEEEAQETGVEVRTATLPARAAERAVIDDDPPGLVKLVADGADGRILGAHIVTREAGAMIHEVQALMRSSDDLAPPIPSMIHAYPTRSEGLAAALVELAS